MTSVRDITDVSAHVPTRFLPAPSRVPRPITPTPQCRRATYSKHDTRFPDQCLAHDAVPKAITSPLHSTRASNTNTKIKAKVKLAPCPQHAYIRAEIQEDHACETIRSCSGASTRERGHLYYRHNTSRARPCRVTDLKLAIVRSDAATESKEA